MTYTNTHINALLKMATALTDAAGGTGEIVKKAEEGGFTQAKDNAVEAMKELYRQSMDAAADRAREIKDDIKPIGREGLTTAMGGAGGAGLGYVLGALLGRPDYSGIKDPGQLEEAKAKAERNKLLGALLGFTGSGIGTHYALK
jgi:hypothetical protein